MNNLEALERDRQFTESLSIKSKTLWNTVRLSVGVTAISFSVLIGSVLTAENGNIGTVGEVAGAGTVGGLAVGVAAAVAYIPSSSRDFSMSQNMSVHTKIK